MKTLIIALLLTLNFVGSSVESSIDVMYEHGRGYFCGGRGLCKVYPSAEGDLLSSKFFYDQELGNAVRLEISKDVVYLGNNENQFENGTIEVSSNIEVETPESSDPIIIYKNTYDVYQTENKYIIFF